MFKVKAMPVILIFSVSAIPMGLAEKAMQQAHQTGQILAKSLHSQTQDQLKTLSPQQVPGFVSDRPAQAALEDHNIGQAAAQATSQNPAAAMLLQQATTRPRFKLDPATDPLFAAKPEPNLATTTTTETSGTRVLTCTQGGEVSELSCMQDLTVQVKTGLTKHFNQTIDYIAYLRQGGHHIGWVKRHSYWFGLDVWYTWHWDPPAKDLGLFKTHVCPFLAREAQSDWDCQRVSHFGIGEINLADKIWYEDPVWNRWEPRLIPIRFNYGVAVETGETWQSHCDVLEARVDAGECQYGIKTCTQGPETRTINGLPVHRDCWQYQQNYHCQSNHDDCVSLRAQGCWQTGSRCKALRDDKCWIYEQSYTCPTGQKTVTRPVSVGPQPFCLTGDCADTAYETNGNMLSAISKLHLMQGIQHNLRQQNNAQTALVDFAIFNGQVRTCTRTIEVGLKDYEAASAVLDWSTDMAGFVTAALKTGAAGAPLALTQALIKAGVKDCCQSKSYGIGLSPCSKAERELSTLRDKGLCHRLGRYCAMRVLGMCVKHKTAFCCFESKLARLFHEQGRSQLGIGWGSPQAPQCRGLTADELGRISFEQIDLGEVFEDMLKQYQVQDTVALQQTALIQMQARVAQIGTDLKQKNPYPNDGRAKGGRNEL